MQSIAAATLLNLWESGESKPPFERALDWLCAARPDVPRPELARWSIGRRDAALLELHALLFGERFQAVAACPRCAARLDLSFSYRDIRAPYAASEPQNETITASDGVSFGVALRAVNSEDLAALEGNPDREALLRRCILRPSREGQPHPWEELPPDVLAACIRRLAENDSQADVRLNLACPECAHAWEAPLDIAAYLWREIEAWALRTVREIHLLASAYGWSEAEICALSPRRRALYLQMVSG